MTSFFSAGLNNISTCRCCVLYFNTNAYTNFHSLDNLTDVSITERSLIVRKILLDLFQRPVFGLRQKHIQRTKPAYGMLNMNRSIYDNTKSNGSNSYPNTFTQPKKKNDPDNVRFVSNSSYDFVAPKNTL